MTRRSGAGLEAAGLAYPIRDGIPIMLRRSARAEGDNSAGYELCTQHWPIEIR